MKTKKIPNISYIAVAVSCLFANSSFAIDITNNDTNISTGNYDNFNITHTIDEFSGGTIKNMSGTTSTVDSEKSLILKMSGTAHIDSLTGRSEISEILGDASIGYMGGDNAHIDTMNGGTITQVDGGTIWDSQNSTFGTISNGNIDKVTNGSITTVSNNGFINYFYSGTVNEFTGGQLGHIYDGAYVDKMSGSIWNTWVNALEGGTINDMSGGSIANMNDGKVVHMRDGAIWHMNGGQVELLSGGTIDEMNNGVVSVMSGGSINLMQNGLVTNMNGGQINVMNNGQVTNMTDGLIVDMQGGEITSATGGTLNNIGQNAKITFYGSAQLEQGSLITGNVANGANLILTDDGNGGFVRLNLSSDSIFDATLTMQGGLVKLENVQLGDNSLFDIQSGTNNTLWVTQHDVDNMNIALATGLSAELNVNDELTTTLTTLNGQSNSVLDKTGNGSLMVTNDGSYTGDINVNGGTLFGEATINGHLSVNQSANLSVGTPNSKGVLNVGQLTLNSDSQFNVKGYQDGSSDLVQVNSSYNGDGTVTINSGAKLNVKNGQDSLWVADKVYTVIDATDGLSGEFSDVTWGTPFLDYQVDYDYADYQVLLTPKRNGTSFCGVAGTFNQCSTAEGVESLGAGNIVYDVILNSASEQAARNAYDNLSGEVHASIKSALLYNNRYPRLMVQRHLESKNSQTSPTPIDSASEVWVDIWMHDGHLSDDGNATRVDMFGKGFMLGSDLYESGKTVLGLSFGYSETDLDIAKFRSSDANIDAIHAIAYGSTQLSAIDLTAGIGYSWLDIDTHRNIEIPGLVSRNSASYKGYLWQAFVEAKHGIQLNEQARIEPYAQLVYQYIKTNDFTENASLAQTGLSQTSHGDDMVLSTIGLRSNWNIDIKSGSNFYADLAWQHNWSQLAPESTMRFDGGDNFLIKGTKLDRNALIIGAGANILFTPYAQLSFGYEASVGNQTADNAVRAKVQFSF